MGEGMTQALTDRYGMHLAGVLSCYDRILITGTLPSVCYADGMTHLLYVKGIRIFDYTKFAEPLRERVREQAKALAREAGIEIEHIAKSHVRKEDVVAKILAKRGTHPGLVHVISAMESCDTYKPWHDKKTGKTALRPDWGKCLHYYFYFVDEELGLIRRPFRLHLHAQARFLAQPRRRLLLQARPIRLAPHPRCIQTGTQGSHHGRHGLLQSGAGRSHLVLQAR
jgi:hypothetical protein